MDPFEQIQQQLQAQKRALPALAQQDLSLRSEALEKLLVWIQAHMAEIEESIFKDFHKPATEVFMTEILPIQLEFEACKKNLKSFLKPEAVSLGLLGMGGDGEIHRVPKGQVLIISPWNYPLALAIQPFIGAILTGNAVILKPSEQTPHTSQIIAKMIREIFPPEWALVIEGGIEVSQFLLKHPFDHIFFTGSTEVGKKVMAAAAEHLTSVTLELGGKSPVVIHSSADLAESSKRIAWGKTLNAGQTCVAPDTAYVHKSVFTEFVRRLESDLHQFSTTDMASIINDKNLERLKSFVPKDYPLEVRSDRRLSARVYLEPAPDSAILKHEIFGPILPILIYENEHDLIQKFQSEAQPLALYIFAEDEKFIQRLVSSTRSGGVAINDVLTHVTQMKLPFGGVGASGLGNYHGVYTLKCFTHERSVFKQSLRGPKAFLNAKMRSQMFPPYSEEKLKTLKKLFQLIPFY